MRSALRRWSLFVLVGVLPVLHVVRAQGPTGFCSLDCLSGFTGCLGTTPGCTSREGGCRLGGECHNGKCPNGTTCPVEWSPECSPCITARGDCLQGCEGSYLPELVAGIRRAGLDQGQERAFLAMVEQAEKGLVVAVEKAVQDLEALEKHIAAQAGKAVDEKVAATLTEIARRTAATLESKGIPECVSTLTTVGELIPMAGGSQQNKQK